MTDIRSNDLLTDINAKLNYRAVQSGPKEYHIRAVSCNQGDITFLYMYTYSHKNSQIFKVILIYTSIFASIQT